MPVTLIFTTGRDDENFPTAADTHERGGVVKVLSAEGKEIAAFASDAIDRILLNGKEVERNPD